MVGNTYQRGLSCSVRIRRQKFWFVSDQNLFRFSLLVYLFDQLRIRRSVGRNLGYLYESAKGIKQARFNVLSHLPVLSISHPLTARRLLGDPYLHPRQETGSSATGDYPQTSRVILDNLILSDQLSCPNSKHPNIFSLEYEHPNIIPTEVFMLQVIANDYIGKVTKPNYFCYALAEMLLMHLSVDS